MEYRVLREIIYVNTDDFCASVIRVRDPTLRARPIVVGYLSNRGAVIGASYEARDAGVRVGLTTAQARRLCPEAAFVPVDWALFRRVSRAIFEVVDRYSPLVEPVGLDEGFLDYTGCSKLFGDVRDVARRLQKEVSRVLSLQVSLGVGANKLVSQIASRAAKLAGLVDVPAGSEREFLAEFPVGWLPGVGTARTRAFAAMGVKTIGTLAGVPAPLVERVLGPQGKTLVERARGVDNRPVLPGRAVRPDERMEASVNFADDVIYANLLDAHLYTLAEALGRKLRRSAKGAKRVQLRLTYTDGYVAAHTDRLPRATALDGELYDEAHVLLKRAFTRRVKVRALNLEAASTVPFIEQADMFSPERGKLDSLYRACDRVREKYGEGRVLGFGRTFNLQDAGEWAWEG